MYRDRDSSLAAKKSTHADGCVLTMFQRVLLVCLAMSVTSCVASTSEVESLKIDVQRDMNKQRQKLEAKVQNISHRLETRYDELSRTLEEKIEEAKQAITNTKDVVLKDLDTVRVQAGSDLRSVRKESQAGLKELEKARDNIKEDLRRVREESLRNLRETLGAKSRDLDKLHGKLETVSYRVDELQDDLKTRLATLHTDMTQDMDQRDQTVQEQFARFRDSLVAFKNSLEKVNLQLEAELEAERNRATSTENNMQDALTKRHADVRKDINALHEKLNADTQTLRNYLADDVKETIQTLNAALEKSNRILGTAIEAQGTRLSETMASLDKTVAALQRTDAQYATNFEAYADNLKETNLALAQLRDALQKTGDHLGARLDRQGRDGTHTTERIEQLESRYTALARKIDADTKALQQAMTKAFEQFEQLKAPAQRVQELNRVVGEMQGMVEKHGEALTGIQQLQQSVQNRRQVLQNLRQAVRDNEGKLKALAESAAQLDKLESLVREHDSWLNDLQNAPR